MGQVAVKISKLDVKKLLDMLNAALAEEWLAYYQYWIGARIMSGPMRTEIEKELLTHADEELGHAVLLADRIIQLEGTPLLDPKQWFEKAQCAYEAPTDPYVEVILEQNLSSERCAIARYQAIADFTFGKDYSTYEMAVSILNDELEHEHDIEDWIEDIERSKIDYRRSQPSDEKTEKILSIKQPVVTKQPKKPVTMKK